MIRGINQEDLIKIKKIHEEFYIHEFSLPDFTKHFIHAFAITDNQDKIITVGGIRPILEVIAITDKNRTDREKVLALNDMLTISAFIAKSDKFEEIHAFVQDENWKRQLKKKGFEDTKGQALIYRI